MEMMLRSLCPTTTPVYTSSLHRLLSLYYSLLFFSLSHHLLLHASSSPSLNNVNDAQLLLQFKASIPNPSLLHNWEPSSNPCSFTGVSCNNNNNNHSSPRVISVDLSFVPLFADFGSVFSNLMSLELLQSLSMGSTNLNGTLSSVPVSSRCGAFFADLDLSNNTLSGSISGLSILGSSCSSLKSLNLSMNSLDGNEISPDSAHVGLGWLKNLETLDLSFNRISGPNVVGWLFRGENCGELKHMSLRGNKVAGTLPVSHCAKLEHLDLSANDFVGEIVGGELAALTELGFLNLSANHFSGEIPALPTGGVLKLLNLSGNDFQGGLSEKLIAGLCPGLVELDLSYNKLSGVIPDGFGSCSYLESLNLSNNSFSGELQVEVLLKMSSLKKVVLAYNSFGGQLPDSVSMLTELESLDLSSNNFSGQIPLGLCSNPTAGAATTSLKELYLQNNMLSGPIPATLSNCSQLVSLDLSFNFLTGTIPRSLGSLSNLRDLIMWLNHLTGVIPEELKNLKMLESLILDFNELGGSIPSGLSNCTNLNWISLSNNRLTGEIPPWIGLLSDLAILKLSNNSFYGRIPPELGDCRSLIWLDLNTNSLSGSIPPSLFKQSGKIADELSTRKRYAYIKNDGSNKACHGAGNLLGFAGIRQDQMTLTRISAKSPCNFTRVYGGITRSTFNNNGSMIFLDISYNMLSGAIPKEMGVMYYIAVLHLSHNNLSGPIPPELGDLKNLNILDLSHNSLEGTIPRSLARLSLLGELDLSNNRLWGSIPESSQFETFSNYSFLNNSGLCGYPLPSCSEISGSNASAGHNKSRGQASLAGTVAMGLLFSLFCIFGLIIALVEIRKRRQKKEASNSTLDVYIDSHPTTANASAWKLTGAREALSINLAAFEKPLQKLTFADLLEATNGFHNDALIGSGGFGDVYKARLKDGSTVAIKKLIHVSGQGDREFTAEMETIGKIKHRNLVPLLGYCKVGEERLLVYEYMRFGSLEDVLHDRKKTGVKLNWGARRKIAIGAARGLAFLHHNCIPHIIHRDMKCSNVLLDDNLEARVSDFGMARMMSVMDTHLSVSTLAGTPGYVPPEYYQSFRCSTKGDVYSYGVVLLELLTGRPPTDSADFGDNNLVGWVKQHAKLRLRDVFDPELMKEEPSLEVELLQHLHVASACLDERPLRRPTMIEVMAMFKKIQAGESGVDSSSTIATVEDDAGFEGVEMSIREGHELSGQ